ncbi:MAG TPA: PfkB family carbohydrate kinase [Candidatus Bathyarchaeia archaeon]|nr:PfkB family carbohydrate kinase [Candidatus Bathyarchaeia archaeon]
MTFNLVGIGNPVYDIIITPAIRTDGRVLSGCSTNACLAVKRLGMQKVGLIGSIGRDFSERFNLDMKKYGIEASLNAEGECTGGFRLVYDNKGDRTLEVLGVAEKISSKNIPEAFLDSHFFLIGPILGEVDFELIKYIKTSTNSTIFLDPQGLVRSVGTDGKIIHNCDRDQFKRIAELVDFVKPNEHESETITGEADPVLALEQLRELGVKVPIVTLADRGSVLLDSGHVSYIPAFQTDAIDPTGAGDTYAGSFIVEYDRTRSIVESALFASAAASIKVEQVGPDFHMTQEEARRRKSEIRGRLR